MGEGLAHIVQGEGGDARAGEGFHFYARFRRGAGRALDEHLARARDGDLHSMAIVQAEGVAERDGSPVFLAPMTPARIAV